jgi:hypothetical protein
LALQTGARHGWRPGVTTLPWDDGLLCAGAQLMAQLL